VRQNEFNLIVRAWTPITRLGIERFNSLAGFVEEPTARDIVNKWSTITGKYNLLTKSEVLDCGVCAQSDSNPASDQPRKWHDFNRKLVHRSALALKEFCHNIKREQTGGTDCNN
jgi:hypothetical protein